MSNKIEWKYAVVADRTDVDQKRAMMGAVHGRDVLPIYWTEMGMAAPTTRIGRIVSVNRMFRDLCRSKAAAKRAVRNFKRWGNLTNIRCVIRGGANAGALVDLNRVHA